MQNTQSAIFTQNVNNLANMLATIANTNANTATTNANTATTNANTATVSTNANATAINAQMRVIDAQINNLVVSSMFANAKNKKLIDKALKNLLAQSNALTAQL